jgi:integrase
MALSVKRGFRILSNYKTNSGETTLLNALGKFIPPDERILLIEDTAEIQLAQSNLVRFEARREQNGVPAVSIRDLLKASLPPHLRVGIILLVQTRGRTYSEGFRLRWDQVDWENRLIRFGNDVKTPGSSEPLPLTDLAFGVLQKWKEQSRSDSPFVFPSLRKPGHPVGRLWEITARTTSNDSASIFLTDHQFLPCGSDRFTNHG